MVRIHREETKEVQDEISRQNRLQSSSSNVCTVTIEELMKTTTATYSIQLQQRIESIPTKHLSFLKICQPVLKHTKGISQSTEQQSYPNG